MWNGCIVSGGEDQRFSPAQVAIFLRELGLIKRAEKISYLQVAGQAGKALAVINTALVDIERTVPRQGEYVTLWTCGEATTGQPYPSLLAVRRDIEHRSLRQGSGVVAHDPAMVDVLAFQTVGRPSDVDNAMRQKQCRSLVFAQRIERNLPVHRSPTGASHGRVDFNWAAKLFHSSSNVQRVQSLEVSTVFFGGGDDV